MLEALADWNPWWTGGRVPPELLGRARELTARADELLSFREVKSITGLRRSGKSTLLYQFIDHLLGKGGISPQRILLVNFEDPVLSSRTLGEVFNEYQARINPETKPYIFLDEVHRCKDWVPFLRKAYDLRHLEQAFITDSSSKFVRAEYAGILTGREVNVYVPPLSFGEYLQWKGLDGAGPRTGQQSNRVRHALEQYLRWGGLPEVVLMDSDTKRKILLENYLADIVHRDVVERHGVDYHKVRELVDFLASNPGALFSPRKYNRTSGLSLETLDRYLHYLSEVFLVELVPRFAHSLRAQQVAPKKVYLTDTGFFGGLGFRMTENLGHLYENAVFSQIRRSGREVYYWKGRGECDFVVKEGRRVAQAVQVCYRRDIGSEAREMRGLKEAMEELRIPEGMVVSAEGDHFEVSDGKAVRFVALRDYLTG